MSRVVALQAISIPEALSLLSWLLSKDMLNVVAALLKLIKPSVTGLLKAPGLYEVLNYKATLEIKDIGGHNAIYTRRERVRFLRDNVSTLYDYGWGDGQSFASHRVSPGRIVDRQSIGPRYKTTIALPSPKNRGDLLTFSIRRLAHDALVDRKCWLEAEIYHKMERMTLIVIFPKERPVKRAYIIAQQAQTTMPVTVTVDKAGRQNLRYSVHGPKVGERYTLQWDW